MNNVFPNEISDIGTDPTTIEVIDTLDFLPLLEPTSDGANAANTANPENASVNSSGTNSVPAINQTGAVTNVPSPQESAVPPQTQPMQPTPGVQPEPTPQPIEPLDDKKNKKGKKKKSTTPNPDKKPHDTLKKVIFAVIILLLMGGVAYGLYFYLSLARKNHKIFTLKDVTIYVGDTISHNINDYGDFSKIDISSCLITGLDSIDASTPGTYNYSVKCGSTKHSAKIEVLSIPEISFATKVVYKKINDIPEIDEFVLTSNEYEYLTDNISLKDNVKSNGVYGISISVSHSSGSEKLGYAVLYVVDKAPAMSLSCTSKTTNKTDYGYSVTDYFVFDENRKNLDYSLRLYNYQYDDELAFENALNNIENNRITIDGRSGYFIMDTINKTISLVAKLDNEQLKAENNETLSETYTAINSYYVNTKNYSCSN